MKDTCPRCGKKHNIPPRNCMQETRISHTIHGTLGSTTILECEFCKPMIKYVTKNFPEAVR